MGRAGRTVTDLVWTLSPNEWAAVGAIGQATAALIAFAALLFLGWQIIAARNEGRRARTIALCERYDLDPVLDSADRKIKAAVKKRILKRRANALSTEIGTMLNFFDQMALGSEEGAYEERLLKCFMQDIALSYYEDLVKSGVAKKIGWLPKNYRAYDDLCTRWRS